jgi:hypothetical protein
MLYKDVGKTLFEIGKCVATVKAYCPEHEDFGKMSYMACPRSLA